MFFDSWEALFRVLIMGTLTYIALVFLLRVSGKRTLSKMNMFDFVITVALGSAFATTILSSDISLVEGVAALGLLIYIQFFVAWLTVRYRWFRRLVKGEAALLFYDGDYLWQSMRKERVTAEEIRAAVRNQGLANMREVRAVVLETEGSLTVVTSSEHEHVSVLQDMKIPTSSNDG